MCESLIFLLDNIYTRFGSKLYHQIELHLNKANISDTEASFLDLHLSIWDGFVKTKVFDKNGMTLILIL